MTGTTDNLEARGAALTFTSQGTLDWGIAWSRAETREAGSYGKLESTSVTPFLAFTFTRPGDEYLIGSELRLSYSFGQVSHEYEDPIEAPDVSTTAFQFGAAVFGQLTLADYFRLMPEAGLYLSYLDVPSAWDSDRDSESDVMFGFVLHFVFGQKSDGLKVILSPGWETLDGRGAYTTSLSVVLPRRDSPSTGWGS